MASYYNEFDPYAAQWLRNLIGSGLIPSGEVDERSIVDVSPGDLAGFTQCHFFAGLGGWGLAARLAGWPDDRELWTGSPPCQPFSVAGQGKAQADDRHLWPHYFRLASARRPAVLMGEQVAAAVGKDWLDGVFTDLEGIGYACGAAVVPACAVDAPHRRDRLWFVAHADDAGPQGQHRHVLRAEEGRGQPAGPAAEAGLLDCAEHAGRAVGDATGATGERRTGAVPSEEAGQHRSGQLNGSEPVGLEYAGQGSDRAGVLADADCAESERSQGDGPVPAQVEGWRASSEPYGCGHRSSWDGAGWITGWDGKARRVEPGIRLLAHGVSGRMAVRRTVGQGAAAHEEEHWYNRIGAVRAFGNAIVPQVAAEVIGAFMDCRP